MPASLPNKTSLLSTIGELRTETTIVSQTPPPSLPAAPGASNTMERLHVFAQGTSASGAHKTSLVLTAPNWLLSLGSDVLEASSSSGSLKAPMPSLVVEVKVAVGQKVEKGAAVVVLESMKTETVLRADVKGVVRAVGCKGGEMVEEGKVLVEIEAEEVKEEVK